MEVINPSVELWEEGNDPIAHIARCASICYQSKNYNAEKMVEHLKKDGHLSMFRHYSHYYIISKHSKAGEIMLDYLKGCDTFGDNPYWSYFIGKKAIYVSTNEQFVMEHEKFDELFNMYEVTRNTFEEKTEDKSLLRYTFCVISSIKVSRELNRVSPNNIAEQSTRYVNFLSKNGDVAICHSVDDHLTAVDKAVFAEELNQECEWYKQHIASGCKPEDARRVLPLDTATRCAYTYNAREWKHIIDLRFFETTGKAAPDAKVVGEMLYKELKKLGYYEK